MRYLKETARNASLLFVPFSMMAGTFALVNLVPLQAAAESEYCYNSYNIESTQFFSEGNQQSCYRECNIKIPCGEPPVISQPPPQPVVPPPPPPIVVTPPPPPPPVVQTPPPIPQVVHTPPFIAPQSIDLTNAAATVQPNVPQPLPPIAGNVINGLQTIAENQFPKAKDAKGSSEWILVRGEPNSEFKRPNEYTAILENGTILVSVRRPSEFALVQTPIGDVALHSDGDLMLTWNDGVLRIFNISAMGSDCKIKFGDDVVGDAKNKTVKVQPGYEVVAASRGLTRADLRPPDGIARRRAQLLANGHIGISEFSVQTVLSNSAIIAQLVQEQSNAKETRILAQMSKMAAVLNHVNSPYGYTIEGKTGVAAGPSAQPH